MSKKRTLKIILQDIIEEIEKIKKFKLPELEKAVNFLLEKES
ncbi:conserved hypothetical protein [Hydrogenobacter thermophilus TK-6]|uniref:Uncharacterized protein n=1 Tax=Hydrogenobacter thermophilus (strain DSM 6534 / IAM 12695 / TK-6) TaxID=608538 RepID=D3DF81_HYDTT|nr:conserved hypothetical protein [Hydrogenobacter thermophilus TK-6]BAI68483.1 hypothetical protein HTH_0016 [Hydrogenobacter thermophilus TK-6]